MRITEKYKSLPVSEIAERVSASLSAVPRLVVTAPPGAGKSTLLPLVMLEELPEGRILMLEPRRIAARQVASRMAEMLGEPVGRTVGYRMRFESRVSDHTRVEVLTEGILTRMLVDDPTLDGAAMVVFDEFHERSLASDTALALTLEAQNVIRPDLRILIMSATIDAEDLCRRFDAPHISSEGRMHDVGIIYGEDYAARDCADTLARAVRRAHREQEGDILAFLPGQGEIMRCAELLEGRLGDTELLPLYGMLSPTEQQRALRPSAEGSRRVILATPIAETSLTIEGIRTVVDSGLCRTPVFDKSSGLSRLETTGISLDMATQRTGRAGRLSNGTCYRLWSRAAEHRMAAVRQPQIETADLAPTLLETAAWGEIDPMRLPWITPPSPGHIALARSLLISLGAVDSYGRITPFGRRLASLPCHPRIGRMLLNADDGRIKALACDIAALLEEKDPVSDENDADITTRIAMLRQMRRNRRCAGRWKRIADISAQYRRLIQCGSDDGPIQAETAGRLIALAYPERIALADESGKYRLAGGEYTRLTESDPLSSSRMLGVAATGSRIYLAAPLDMNDARAMAVRTESVAWDSRAGRVSSKSELRLGVLVIESRPAETDRREEEIEAICKAAPKHGLTMFDFNDATANLQQRIATVAEWHPEMNLPQVDTESLLMNAADWLPLYIGKATTVAQLSKIDICAVIWGLLDYETQIAVDRIAPTRFTLPSGRSVRVEYRQGAEFPVIRARLQDCFGLTETPRLDDGRRPALMELLSPGFKPVQLTQDMAGFWQRTYFEVRKELRRRYPKHRWPDDPSDPGLR